MIGLLILLDCSITGILSVLLWKNNLKLERSIWWNFGFLLYMDHLYHPGVGWILLCTSWLHSLWVQESLLGKNQPEWNWMLPLTILDSLWYIRIMLQSIWSTTLHSYWWSNWPFCRWLPLTSYSLLPYGSLSQSVSSSLCIFALCTPIGTTSILS